MSKKTFIGICGFLLVFYIVIVMLLVNLVKENNVQINGVVEQVVTKGDITYFNMNDKTYVINPAYSENKCQFIKEGDNVTLKVNKTDGRVYKCEYK